MSPAAFDTLYDLVTSRGEGWMEALVNAWFGPCYLSEDQKNLIEAAVV